MPFQTAPGVAQVVVQQQCYGQLIVNVLHVDNGTDLQWTPGELLALANEVKSAWKTQTGTAATSGPSFIQSTSLLIQKVIATDLTVENGDQGIATVADGTGAAASAPMEASLALVVTSRTGRSGRSYRGRSYIGGIASAGVGADANHVVSTFASGIAENMMFLKTRIATLSGAPFPVVLSRYEDLALRPVAVPTAITSYTANTRLDNQRRRMPPT